MKLRYGPITIAIVAFAIVLPAAAQTVVDGDSIAINGKQYRLYGIDAPDPGHICLDGWPAAYEAEAYLGRLMKDKEVNCIAMERPQKDETQAICRADGVDVGAAMVTGGMAFAYVPYSARYIVQEESAAAAKRGVHGHKCVPPWTWRARLGSSD
jgi:endonuclease YncB( thermonuclease family)